MRISSLAPLSPNDERYRQKLLEEYKRMAALYDNYAGSISVRDMEAVICESIPDCSSRRKNLTPDYIRTHTYDVTPEQKDVFIEKYGYGLNFNMNENISILANESSNITSMSVNEKRGAYYAAAEIICNIENTCVADGISKKRNGFLDETEFMYYFQHCARLKTAEV